MDWSLAQEIQSMFLYPFYIKSILILSFQLSLHMRPFKFSFNFGFSACLSYPQPLVHLIILGFITIITFSEEYKLCNFSLRNKKWKYNYFISPHISNIFCLSRARGCLIIIAFQLYFRICTKRTQGKQKDLSWMGHTNFWLMPMLLMFWREIQIP